MKRATMDQATTAAPVRVSALDAIDTNLIDVAIWTMMCDFKKRTAKEIVDNLTRLGYHRVTSDKRLDTLLKSKHNWFDRPAGQRGGTVAYQLKKGIKNPADKLAPVVKDGETKIGVRLGQKTRIWDLASTMGVTPAVLLKFMMNNGYGMAMTVNSELDFETAKKVAEQYNHHAIPRPNLMADSFTPNNAQDGINLDRRDASSRPFVAPVGIAAAIAASSTPKSRSGDGPVYPNEGKTSEQLAEATAVARQAVKDEVEKINNPPKNIGHPPIANGDNVDVAIWKIMHDYQAYTANDIALLLADFGFKDTTVKPRMSVLHGDGINGWFTRISNPSNPKQFIYTLKRELEMPKNVLIHKTAPTAVVPAALAKEVQAVAAQPTQPQPKEQEEMTPALSAVPAPTVTYPLFAVDVVIKGKVFSLEEARVLGMELLDGGFGEESDGKEVVPPRFLKVKVEIAGEFFTMDEANELALTMLKEGIIKKTV